MNEEKKSGYVAGGIFLFIGILILFIGIDAGWNSSKLIMIIGMIFTLLGVGGLWKPEIIGQLLVHYLEKFSENQKNDSLSQIQKNTRNSNQTMAKDKSKVVIQNNYYRSNLPEEKTSNEKYELIKEIKQDLTKEKLSNTIIKCIRLAKIINFKKDVYWLENEAKGFDDLVKQKNKREEDIPKYRIINTEIRIASNANIGYTPIDYKLTLGHPVFQIEEWIESYEKNTLHGEMILRAPLTDNLKKVYKEVLNKAPPEQEVPYIISISELKGVLNGLKLRINEFVLSIK